MPRTARLVRRSPGVLVTYLGKETDLTPPIQNLAYACVFSTMPTKGQSMQNVQIPVSLPFSGNVNQAINPWSWVLGSTAANLA